MGAALDRIHLLIEQDRYDQAEKELGPILEQNFRSQKFKICKTF